MKICDKCGSETIGTVDKNGNTLCYACWQEKGGKRQRPRGTCYAAAIPIELVEERLEVPGRILEITINHIERKVVVVSEVDEI